VLPIRLAQGGYSVVLVVGRGTMNNLVLHRFADANSVSHNIFTPTRSGDLTNSSIQCLAEMYGTDEEPFDSAVVAACIKHRFPGACWDVFTEPWYDDLTHHWQILHFTQFVEDLSALALKGLTLDVPDSSRFHVYGAAMQSEVLWQRLRPLSTKVGGTTRWNGLDLCAVNDLYCGQPDCGHSVDLWMLRSLNAIRLVSKPVHIAALDATQLISSQDVQIDPTMWRPLGAGKLRHDAGAIMHGVVLWVQRGHSMPGDADLYTALSINNRQAAAHLMSARFGVVLLDNPLTTSKDVITTICRAADGGFLITASLDSCS